MKIYLFTILLIVAGSSFGSCLKSLNAKKIEMKYAKHFEAYKYSDGFYLKVNSPWQHSKASYEYILHRGAVPKACTKIANMKIPIKRIITYSTTSISALEVLDKIDTVVGITDMKYVSNKDLLLREQKGLAKSIGYPARPEIVMGLNPDIIMAFVSTSPEVEGTQKLLDLKLPLVYNADYKERHPLGRSEWIKFISLFYDEYTIAEIFFNEVEKKFKKLSHLTSGIKTRPKILLGHLENGKWRASGGDGYINYFINQAGGRYVWGDEKTEFPTYKQLEELLTSLGGVSTWILFTDAKTKNELERENYWYKTIAKRIEGKIYNCNKIRSKRGGNEFFESGPLRPDLVLRDFIQMIHPEKIEGKKNLKWFRELK